MGRLRIYFNSNSTLMLIFIPVFALLTTLIGCEDEITETIPLDLKDVEILHPTKGRTIIAGSIDSILWSNPKTIERYSLYYSLNNGKDWTSISTNGTDQSGKFIWNVPDTFTGSAKIRILATSEKQEIYIESDSVFSILLPLQIIEPSDSAVFIDPASIQISWNTLIPFDKFEIYYSKFSDSIITFGYPDNKREYSSEWILLSDNLPGSESEYIWEEPYLYSNKVKIKVIGITDGNKYEAMSKKIFTIRVNEILTEERKYQEKLAVGNRWKYKISDDYWGYDSTYYFLIRDVVSTFLDGGIKYYEIEQMKITDTVTYSLIQLKDREHYSPSYILEDNDVFSTHFYSWNENWKLFLYHSESRNDLSEEIFAETQLVKEDNIYDSGSGISSEKIKRAKDFGVYYRKSGGEGYYTITTLIGALIDGIVYGDTTLAMKLKL